MAASIAPGQVGLLLKATTTCPTHYPPRIQADTASGKRAAMSCCLSFGVSAPGMPGESSAKACGYASIAPRTAVTRPGERPYARSQKEICGISAGFCVSRSRFSRKRITHLPGTDATRQNGIGRRSRRLRAATLRTGIVKVEPIISLETQMEAENTIDRVDPSWDFNEEPDFHELPNNSSEMRGNILSSGGAVSSSGADPVSDTRVKKTIGSADGSYMVDASKGDIVLEEAVAETAALLHHGKSSLGTRGGSRDEFQVPGPLSASSEAESIELDEAVAEAAALPQQNGSSLRQGPVYGDEETQVQSAVMKALRNGQGSFVGKKVLNAKKRSSVWKGLQNTGFGKVLARDSRMVAEWMQSAVKRTGMANVLATNTQFVKKPVNGPGSSSSKKVKEVGALKIIEDETAGPLAPSRWPQPYYPELRGAELLAADLKILENYGKHIQDLVRSFQVPLQNDYDPDQVAVAKFIKLSGILTGMVLKAWTSIDGDEMTITDEQTETQETLAVKPLELEDRTGPPTATRPQDDLEAEWLETIALRSNGTSSSLITLDRAVSTANGFALPDCESRENGAVNGNLKNTTESQEDVRDTSEVTQNQILSVQQSTHLDSSPNGAFIPENVNGAAKGATHEMDSNKNHNGALFEEQSLGPQSGMLINGIVNGVINNKFKGPVTPVPLDRLDPDAGATNAEELLLRDKDTSSSGSVHGTVQLGSETDENDVPALQESRIGLTLEPGRKKVGLEIKTNGSRQVKKGGKSLPSTMRQVLSFNVREHPQVFYNLYDKMLRAGRLQDCIVMLEKMDKAGLLVSMKLNHFRFYEACKKRRAVKEAFTFTRLFQSSATLRNYNMLLSVCSHAKDIDGALRVLGLLEVRGLKADCILYTTLISTCAKAEKIDLVFQIFHEMETAGVKANAHTFGAMIDGCARAGQLPKAFGAYGIMMAKGVKADRVIFNSLINACGRAGAVQRAFDVLSDMKAEATPVKPDHVTYGALIAACARGGEVDKALDVYKRMRSSNTRGSPECYTAAVHACSQNGDLDSALSVFDDLKKDGVRPDEVFFSALINVAGHSGNIERAFSILQDMKGVGMKPGPVVYSSLMGVCSKLGNWQRALDLYKEIHFIGLRPSLSTYNALMTALCGAKQLKNALSVLEDLRTTGVAPNQISYSILLEACEKEDEAETALDMYTTTRVEGIKPNVVMCDSITGLCLRRIKSSAPAPQRSCSILPASGNNNLATHEQWAIWALAIYRQTVEAGVVPTIESLAQLLGCLRKEEIPVETSSFDERSLAFLGQPRQTSPLPTVDGFGVYDPRALALFEEAAALKVVPSFNYTTGTIVIAAESMPVYAAEVCLLTVLKGLKHRHAAGARVPAVIITYAVEKKEHYTAKGGQIAINIAGRTGQAVGALLRRLRLKFQGHESSGELRLTMLGIRKWLQPKPNPTEALSSNFMLPEPSHSPYSLLARTIADQQRAIRMGDVPPHYRDLDILADMGHGQDDDAESDGYETRRPNGPSRSRRRSSSVHKETNF